MKYQRRKDGDGFSPGQKKQAQDLEDGGIGKGAMVAIGAVLLIVAFGGSLVSTYNGLISGQERTKAAWSEIDNQYKRRFELIPQLVNTVKGAASFEKSTLQAVTEARASVGRAQLPATLPTDPAKVSAYMAAQQSLGGALGRLFAVSERYPELKATRNFLSLQDQLEGTDNRIAVARRDYIEAVRAYNTHRRRFPASLIANTFGFEKAAELTIEASARSVPTVNFDSEKK